MKKFFDYQKSHAFLEKWEPGCWVQVTLPTSEDIHYLVHELQVPEEFLNDIEDSEERARTETENGWRLIIMRVPCRTGKGDASYITTPMGIMIKDDVFVTLNYPEIEMIPDFIHYCTRKSDYPASSSNLLLALFLSSSVWYLKYLKQINAHIKLSETSLSKSIRNEELYRLMRIEKCLVYFTTSLRSNETLLAKLKSMFKNTRIPYDNDLLEDVEIELAQAYSTSNISSDIVSHTMTAFASVISNNLNIIMKNLTLVSVILMIPTLIASFYGMNMENGLEHSLYGFPITILLSLILSGLGVYLIRRKRFF